MKDYNVIAKKINKLLSEIANKLPEEDFKNIDEFIEHKEFGLAYETLCTQLYEYNILISQEYYECISIVGGLIGLQSYIWLPLKELIKKNNSK